MCWHELLLEVKPQISSVEAQTQRKVSVKRGLRCTRETAIEYIDDLAAHLIEVGIAPTLSSEAGARRLEGRHRSFADMGTPHFINYSSTVQSKKNILATTATP